MIHVRFLKTNNCPKCLCRIFVTSGGCAECSNDRCENWLKPLAYVENAKINNRNRERVG